MRSACVCFWSVYVCVCVYVLVRATESENAFHSKSFNIIMLSQFCGVSKGSGFSLEG